MIWPLNFMNQKENTFKAVKTTVFDKQRAAEDTESAFFDADGDGDNDLYVTRGSYQHDPGSNLYQDILCENDGKGNFTPLSTIESGIYASLDARDAVLVEAGPDKRKVIIVANNNGPAQVFGLN